MGSKKISPGETAGDNWRIGLGDGDLLVFDVESYTGNDASELTEIDSSLPLLLRMLSRRLIGCVNALNISGRDFTPWLNSSKDILPSPLASSCSNSCVM